MRFIPFVSKGKSTTRLNESPKYAQIYFYDSEFNQQDLGDGGQLS